MWDLATRASSAEIGAAGAQASARFALHEITRVAAAAGAGGLYVTQAVAMRPDPDLPGISAPPDGDHDNVVGGSVPDLGGAARPVRDGTDVLELRGVLYSPLLALDGASGCGACAGSDELTVRAVTATGHVNHDAGRRPGFARIDDATRSVSPSRPFFVVVSGGADRHAPCAALEPGEAPPQPAYVVGRLASPTALASAGTFGPVDFADGRARELTTEDPRERAGFAAAGPSPALRAGLLDDVVFFVDDTDPWHPTLARGLRRGDRFDVVPLAEDVEDLQIAYGVDGLYASDAVSADGSLRRLAPPEARDPDPEVSIAPDGDEWAPNADGERIFHAHELQSAQPPPAGFPHGPGGETHCPRLLAVAIAIVARSRDPEAAYLGPDSLGLKAMNSPPETRRYPGASPPRFRRRLLSTRVFLRNY